MNARARQLIVEAIEKLPPRWLGGSQLFITICEVFSRDTGKLWSDSRGFLQWIGLSEVDVDRLAEQTTAMEKKRIPWPDVADFIRGW